MPGAYTVTTRTTGQTLTASFYNADHQNHIDHLEPQYIDDASTNLAAMQATTDPGELTSESLATTLAGEVARIRFAVKEIKTAVDPHVTQWYETPYGMGYFNVKSYGAVGDNSTDDTTAIQAALSACAAVPGGVVYLPPGTYKTTAALAISQWTVLRGSGKRNSVIHAAHTGNGITSTWPINSSTPVYIHLEHLGLTGDAGSTGAGFVDLGGSFVDLYSVYIHGFKYGVIFDQTEIATIDCCVFDAQLATGAGLWIVNGNDRTASCQANYTNRITVTRNQFNEGSTNAYGIVDDGGVAHTISDNNFDGGTHNVRLCGVKSCVIKGNEWEASTSTALRVLATTWIGTTGGSIARPHALLIEGNLFGAPYGQSQIDFTDCASAVLLANNYGSSSAYRVLITSMDYLQALGNYITGGPTGSYSGSATYAFIADANTAQDPAARPGIQFQNTQAALAGTTTNTLLRHYEEGTFTPAFSASGNTFNYATNGQKGYYEKIGRRVWFNIYLELATSGNTLTGATVTITGLPFLSSSLTNNYSIGQAEWVNFSASLVALKAQVTPNESQVHLFVTTAAATSVINMAGNNMHATNGSILIVSGSYAATT